MVLSIIRRLLARIKVIILIYLVIFIVLVSKFSSDEMMDSTDQSMEQGYDDDDEVDYAGNHAFKAHDVKNSSTDFKGNIFIFVIYLCDIMIKMLLCLTSL